MQVRQNFPSQSCNNYSYFSEKTSLEGDVFNNIMQIVLWMMEKNITFRWSSQLYTFITLQKGFSGSKLLRNFMYFIIVIFTLCAIVYSYHLQHEVCALDTHIAYVMVLYMFELSNIVYHDRFVLLDEMIVSRQRAHNLRS